MRAKIWAVTAGAAIVVAGISGVAAASGPSPKPRPAATQVPDFFDARVTGLLAARLGVSDAVARTVADQLRTLAGPKGSLSPADPAFIAIARGAGVTPQQLAGALAEAKKGGAKERCS